MSDKNDNRMAAKRGNSSEGGGAVPSDNPLAAMLALFDPQKVAESNLKLFKSYWEIGMGTSEIAADPKDARFADEAWKSNPMYKRLSQAYLATCEAVDAMIPEGLDRESKARAELASSIAMSALAPTNTLPGNPAALRRTLETGGANLSRGFEAFLKDLRDNDGLPQQVDDSEFEVGRNLAVTPGKIVFRCELFELIQYAPSTEKVHEIPALLIPPMIGRYYFSDLAPGRSFAEWVVSQQLQYFVISWRNPSPEHRNLGLQDYAEAALEAMDVVSEITGQQKISVLGFCAGGILASIVSAYLAAKGKDRLNTFTLNVVMVDFDVDASIGSFRFPALLKVAKAQSETNGILSGSDLSKVFTWLRPNDLVWNYWVNNYLMGDAPPAFDILAWNKDSTNMPARLHAEFLELFEDNSLVRPGAYRLKGEPIDFTAITCDAFVVGAVTDHITPWKGCYLASQKLGGDVTFALSNGGHIVALVNPPGNPKAWHQLGPADVADADEWQAKTGKLGGSWWESWTRWAAERSGRLISAASTLGSEAHPPLADAPGDYVRQ